MTLRELFDFVTDINITENNIDAYLENVLESISSCWWRVQAIVEDFNQHVIFFLAGDDENIRENSAKRKFR